MITKKYPCGHLYKDEFESLYRISKGEGYSTFTAKKEGKFFVIDDSGTLADFLEEQESRELISIHQFQNLRKVKVSIKQIQIRGSRDERYSKISTRLFQEL